MVVPTWSSPHARSSHQGAVTHPHFEKVNIFIDILNMLPCYDKPFCLPPIHRKPFKSNYSPLWFYLCEGFFDFNIGIILNIVRVHLHHPSWWLNTSLMLHPLVLLSRWATPFHLRIWFHVQVSFWQPQPPWMGIDVETSPTNSVNHAYIV